MQLVLNGNKLGHINLAGVGATTVVIKSASVHPIADNEEIFILSTQTNPESRNSRLKIGTIHSNYLNTRRG
jgi:hypothetical protein